MVLLLEAMLVEGDRKYGLGWYRLVKGD